MFSMQSWRAALVHQLRQLVQMNNEFTVASFNKPGAFELVDFARHRLAMRADSVCKT